MPCELISDAASRPGSTASSMNPDPRHATRPVCVCAATHRREAADVKHLAVIVCLASPGRRLCAVPTHAAQLSPALLRSFDGVGRFLWHIPSDATLRYCRCTLTGCGPYPRVLDDASCGDKLAHSQEAGGHNITDGPPFARAPSNKVQKLQVSARGTATPRLPQSYSV